MGKDKGKWVGKASKKAEKGSETARGTGSKRKPVKTTNEWGTKVEK